MNKVVFTIVSLTIVAVSAGLMYLYLTNRQREGKKIKDFFTFKVDKERLIFIASVFAVSVFAYLYSFFFVGAAFIKALMDSEVWLWLAALGYIDIKEKLIPNRLILVGIASWVVFSLLEIFVAGTPWKQVLFFSLIGAFICGGVLFVIALVAKSALGMGDVKMFFVIGLLYGLTKTYSILLFSIIPMALYSVAMLIMKKATRKTAVPMAPFVAFGFFLNVLIGM